MTDIAADSPTADFSLHDIEQLQQAVSPWEVEMQQLTNGELHARERLAPVRGILITLEHWNQRLLTRGSTPPGYLVVGGSFQGNPVYYCDTRLDFHQVAAAHDGAEVGFVTPENSLHWTMLIPLQSVQARPGFEHLARRTESRSLGCSEAHHEQMRRLISLALNCGINSHMLPDTHPLVAVLEAELLDAVETLLNDTPIEQQAQRTLAHWDHAALAIARAALSDYSLNPSELADTAGVSPRVLQQSFNDTVGISPHRFLKNARLHEVRKLLLNNHRAPMSVTEAMTRWGFKELGRAAGEYRELFSELPSATLHRSPAAAPRSFASALRHHS